VGEIHTEDTDQWNEDSTEWIDSYNAAHWDGDKWELKRIMFYTFCNQTDTSAYPARAVYNFGDKIIISSGSQVTYIENEIQTNIECVPVSINAIWGTSSSDFYVVGYGGNIVHYNGLNWRKISSGTDLPLRDIWGDYNERTGEWEILCVASNKYYNEGSKLLKITDGKVIGLSNEGLSWSLSGVWFIKNKKYFIAGDGIYPSLNLSQIWERDVSFPSLYKDAVRGTHFNNIVVSGSNGLLSHFNGFSWRHYAGVELPIFSGRYYGVDISDEKIVAVGYNGTQAIIRVGEK
jgi:hypothetical protein